MMVGVVGVVARVLVARARRAAALRKLDVVGLRPTVLGEPFVRNLGRVEIGDDFVLVSRPTQSYVITGPNGVLRIGNGVHLGHGAGVNVHTSVTLGDSVHFGPEVVVIDSTLDEDRAAGPPRSRAIVIGAGVRVGARCTILPGVRIGDGTVIEEGSVVSRSLPSYVRAAGVPAMPVES